MDHATHGMSDMGEHDMSSMGHDMSNMGHDMSEHSMSANEMPAMCAMNVKLLCFKKKPRINDSHCFSIRCFLTGK